MCNITEIKLVDLAEDNSFFNDLKEGKFILVLGAGFSYGLPNRAGETIPIVKEFVELTCKKFGQSITPNDYNRAADIWLRYIEDEGIEISEKERRFNEFRALFLIDEKLFKDKKELYSAILLPKWNHIYIYIYI